VPIDYAKPGGATMRVAVIRKPASGKSRGSLIINPGGPGASGVDYARGSAGTFTGVTPNFDLVSFDPRGVGASKPIRCESSSQLDAFVSVDPTPDTPALRMNERRSMKFLPVDQLTEIRTRSVPGSVAEETYTGNRSSPASRPSFQPFPAAPATIV